MLGVVLGLWLGVVLGLVRGGRIAGLLVEMSELVISHVHRVGGGCRCGSSLGVALWGHLPPPYLKKIYWEKKQEVWEGDWGHTNGSQVWPHG